MPPYQFSIITLLENISIYQKKKALSAFLLQTSFVISEKDSLDHLKDQK